MNALRVEADEAQTKADEYRAKVKALEQENLAKEQDNTSLSHKIRLLEDHNEKLEVSLKEAKIAVDQSSEQGTHNESLQRKLQLMEDEAEVADKDLREAHERYNSLYITKSPLVHAILTIHTLNMSLTQSSIDFVKAMSRMTTTSRRSRLSRWITRSWKRSFRTSRPLLPICKRSMMPMRVS